MKINVIIALVVIFNSMLFSKDYIKLYEDYIPKEILKNELFKKNINETLELYCKLDPNLIYYYLTNLHLKMDEKISDPDSNFTNSLQARFSKAKQLKRDWAKLNIKLTYQNLSPTMMARRVAIHFIGYGFENYKEVIIDQSQTVDTNMQDFFKFIYFKDKEGIKYDPQIDYTKLYKDVVKEIVDNFDSKIKNIKTSSRKEVKALIRSAFGYSYLFKGTYLDYYDNLSEYSIYEIISLPMDEQYNNTSSISTQVSYGILPISFKGKLEFTDPFDHEYKYNYDTAVNNSYFIFLGLKLKVKPRLEPLSFIKFKIGYALSQSLSDSLKRYVFFDGIKAISGLGFNGRYYISNCRDFKAFAISSQLTFPVYYIYRYLMIEAGVSYQYQALSFEYDFVKEGEYTDPYGRGVPEDFLGSEVIKFDKNKHLFYPVVAVNYDLFKLITLRLEYLFPNQIVTNMGIHLSF